MVDYLRGECYKVSHRQYLYITLAVLMGLEALLVVLWAWMNGTGGGMAHIAGADGFSMVASMLSIGFYASVLMADMVFSEQYKFNTLKNEVSFGLSRSRIYLGKLAVEIAVSLAVCLLALVWYGVLCAVLLPGGGDWADAVSRVGFSLAGHLPVWLGCLGFTHMLFFTFRNNTVASFLAVGVTAAAPTVLQLLAVLVSRRFLALYGLLYTSPVEDLARHYGDWSVMGRSLAVGLGWFAVSTAIGLAVFRKREIS